MVRVKNSDMKDDDNNNNSNDNNNGYEDNDDDNYSDEDNNNIDRSGFMAPRKNRDTKIPIWLEKNRLVLTSTLRKNASSHRGW